MQRGSARQKRMSKRAMESSRWQIMTKQNQMMRKKKLRTM